MTTYRTERFISTLRAALAEIIVSETDDPQLKKALVSHVHISPDLRTAKIFITASVSDIEPLVRKLNRAKGHFKRRLPGRMALRYVPDLHFLAESGPDIEKRLPNKET